MPFQIIKGGLDFPVCPKGAIPLINQLIAIKSLVGLVRTLNRDLLTGPQDEGSMEFRVGEIEGTVGDITERIDGLISGIQTASPCPEEA